MNTYEGLFTLEEISNELSKRISILCPPYFGWMDNNSEALERLRITCEVFIGNMTGIIETKNFIDETTKYSKFIESVNRIENQLKEVRDESPHLWAYYYKPIKIIEQLKTELNRTSKQLDSYGFNKKKISMCSLIEEGPTLQVKDALICSLAIIFENYYNNENGTELDLVNFPVARSEIFTKTLSPDDLNPAWLNSKNSESSAKQKNRTSLPTEKALFFTGPFYWFIWGVFEILDIPHRNQVRKVDNGEFQNLCDDSHAFAKKIFRALDSYKSNIAEG